MIAVRMRFVLITGFARRKSDRLYLSAFEEKLDCSIDRSDADVSALLQRAGVNLGHRKWAVSKLEYLEDSAPLAGLTFP